MKQILIALSLITLSSAAIAADGVEFSAVDLDTNGVVSFEEAQTAMPELTAEGFAAVDIDASGDLSLEEFTALPGAMVAN